MSSRTMYTKGEEIFNSVSHGVGSLLSVVGCAVMVTLAACFRNWVAVVSACVYGLSMIVLYTMSTLYHAIPYQRPKGVLRVLDHASVYLLIAGSYTPITLLLLNGSRKGLLLFATVWVLAIAGIVLNVVDMQRFRKVSMALYLMMGWAALLDIRNIVTTLGSAGSVLLIAGGVCYTVGVVFYKLKRIRYMHGVWHLFVLAGSVLHYLCILLYIILA